MSANEASRYWFRQALAHMVADPLRALRLSAVKALVLINDFEVPDSENYALARERLGILRWLPSFAVLCGLGLLGMILCLRQPDYWLPFGLLLCHALTVILLYNFGRFRLGMMPIWILFTAHAIVWLVREARAARISRVVAGVAFAAALTVISYLPPIGYADTDYQEITQEMDQVLQQRARLLEEIKPVRQAASQERGRDVTRRLALARALVQAGNEDEAERWYAEIHASAPNLTGALHEWAVLKVQREQFDEAIAQLRRVIRAQPNNVMARLHLADALQRQSPNLLERAAAELEAALQIAPDDPRVRLTLAVLRFQQQRVEEAQQHVAEVLRTVPDHPEALRLREAFQSLHSETP